jgi:lipopolysaccharide transport system ATP-binding protein
MSPAISIDGISKLYHLGGGRDGYRTLRETLSDALSRLGRRATTSKPGGDELWALHDVSFDIESGQVIGVIGRNGAGKSTLLKVLSHITEPTTGKVTLRGRVGSLLEVGTGFHHELTGRENIYLNGAILGMSRQEIRRKFDAIVTFAEIEQFLDTPVKRYSSGMFVKLAFAVASHLEPEILIVDEVLAVGDTTFQKKCLGKMDEVSRSGRTILFVSHNMATVMHLCNKVAVLEKGKLAFLGDTLTGIGYYNQNCSGSTGGGVDLTNHPRRRPGCKPVLGSVSLRNSEGRETDQIVCGEAISLELRIHPDSATSQPHFAVGVDDTLGSRLFTVATYLSDSDTRSTGRSTHAVCRVDQLPLTPGRYALTLNAGPRNAVWTDVIDQALWFDVVPADFYGNGKQPNPDWGRFLVRSKWSAENA